VSTPVYPCLKENDWAGHEASLCRPLWSGRASQFMPWVAFGHDHPHTFQFLSKNEGTQDAIQLEREAVRNLRLRQVEWTDVAVKLSFFKKLKMQVCQGDFLAAERILDAGFMTQAQTTLNARGILVGIPVRGMMFAMDGEAGADRITAFVALVASQYRAAESAPISPAVFAMKDGLIVEIVEAGAEAFASHAAEEGDDGDEGDEGDEEDEDEDEDEDVPGDDDPGEPYIMNIVSRNEAGLENVIMTAAGTDASRLGRAIVNAMAQTLTAHLSRPEFGGHVRVVLLANTPQAVREELAPLEEHLRGIVAELSAESPELTRSKRTLTVEVVHQEPDHMFRSE
jgi:hypothetical protein